MGLFVLRQNKNPADPTDVLPLLPHIHIDLRFEAGEQRILLNGEDVSEAIRLPEASAAASAVSALPEVRAYLLEQQRSLARQYNVIMDGRDIGTVVLPQATIKLPDRRPRGPRPPRLAGTAAEGIKESYEVCWPPSLSGTTMTATGLPPRCARRRTRGCATAPIWILRERCRPYSPTSGSG